MTTQRTNMKCIIISGGSGRRLWPLSQSNYPKQFHKIFDVPLLEKTIERLRPLGELFVLTTSELKALTEQTLKKSQVSLDRIIYEPCSKNTAPAIALACWTLLKTKQEDAVVGIFPSDHVILQEDIYKKAVQLAEKIAQKKDVIVTLGIKPTYPATGYGYIETSNKELEQGYSHIAYQCMNFCEKPSLEKAQQYFNNNQFYWNSGVFVFKVHQMISLFEKYMPQLWSAFKTLKEETDILNVYNKIPAESIDYGIMEKAKNIACIPCHVDWSDVGCWDEVAKLKKSENQILSIDGDGQFVWGDKKKIYSFINVPDVLFIETQNATLVCKKGMSQKVKKVISKLENKKNISEQNFEIRPWGQFEVLKNTDEFKSKVIEVEPGHQISYQSHKKREEHWIIIKGQPEVVLNDKVHKLHSGEYIKIPRGAKHRIRNPSQNETVQFIEVQLGSYFGEDDIERYEDDYNR